MDNIKPIDDRVLVEKLEENEVHSGIVLPESAQGNNNIGKVLAVGNGKLKDDGSRASMSVSVGQKVIFSWGEKVELNGNEYHIVSESNILAVIE